MEVSREMLLAARERLWKAQERFNYFPNMVVSADNNFEFQMQDKTGNRRDKDTRLMFCYLESELLLDILQRKKHWNNAELGCLILFRRDPDIYDPDFHTMMSFFHT